MAKHIFVTGGVVSSLGKGLTSRSIGMLLEHRGLRVRLQKFDPYINVDPGTMSPYQHGEVYVLDDGAETDLDLGHYERFTNAPLSRDCNYTTGKIYQSVIEKERQRRLPGPTVQVIPHVTDEIKAGDPQAGRRRRGRGHHRDRRHRRRHRRAAVPRSDPPVRPRRRQAELPVHPPDAGAVPEGGRRSEDQADAALRRRAAADRHPARHPHLPHRARARRRTTARRSPCSATSSSGPSSRSATRSSRIYEVPLSLVEQQARRADRREAAACQAEPLDIDDWRAMLERITQPGARGDDRRRRQVHQAPRRLQVGLRVARPRRHRPPRRVIDPQDRGRGDRARGGRASCSAASTASWCPAASATAASTARSRRSATPARTSVPFFGICLGLQCAVIEFARNVLGLDDANSTEFDQDTPHPVVCLLDEQHKVTADGRHDAARGVSPASSTPGSKAHAAYGADVVTERHRHRYEFNNDYREQFDGHGLRHLRHEPRRQAGRGDRAAEPPVVPGACSATRSSSRSRRSRTRCSATSSAALALRKSRAAGCSTPGTGWPWGRVALMNFRCGQQQHRKRQHSPPNKVIPTQVL